MKNNRIVFWLSCAAGLAAITAAFGSTPPPTPQCPAANSSSQPWAFCCNETQGVICNQYYSVSATDKSKIYMTSDASQTCDTACY